MQKIQPSLAASNRNSLASFNPAMSVAIDQAFSWSRQEVSNYEFRAAEIGLAANVDPFTKGYAFINGTQDEIEVEEAALQTTALPYNLSVKAGRFFADFGRFSKWHDHDLPFVNRPIALDTFVGGESQSDGIEFNYLVPAEHFVSLTFGGYNKVGGENERITNDSSRKLSEFSFLGKAVTSFELNNDNSFDLSASAVITPQVGSEEGSSRSLYNLELTYRYIPLNRAWYEGITWGTEYLYNSEKFGPELDEGSEVVNSAPFSRKNASGLYSYIETKLSNRYRPGFLFDWAQDIRREEGVTLAYSPYLSIWLSEFNRLRVQYTFRDVPGVGGNDNQVFLQWTAFLGSHTHGFRDR